MNKWLPILLLIALAAFAMALPEADPAPYANAKPDAEPFFFPFFGGGFGRGGGREGGGEGGGWGRGRGGWGR